MSSCITVEFPDGERLRTTTNPQKHKYEDYYHKGKWYNISELKAVDEHKEDKEC